MAGNKMWDSIVCQRYGWSDCTIYLVPTDHWMYNIKVAAFSNCAEASKGPNETWEIGRFSMKYVENVNAFPKTKTAQPYSEVYYRYFPRLVFVNSLTKHNKLGSFAYSVVILFLPLSHIPPCYRTKPPHFPRLFEPRVIHNLK